MKPPSRQGIIFFLTALVVFASLLTPDGVAQVTTARLEGVIKDATDAVVPGVTVVATNSGTNISTETVTNQTGLYVFPRLQPGAYVVSAELSGFKRAVRRGIRLEVGDTATLNITLETGELSETVTVEAEVATVDHVSTSIGKVVNTRQIEDLPLVSRDPMQLFYLQPGANRFVGGGRIDGLRGTSSNITVEGVAAQEPDLGSGADNTQAPVPIEAVGEYRVVTSSASAEYGRGGGAQVQVIYRSGTNDFHGSAFEFHRNKALNANSFANNRQGLPKDSFIRNQFGGSIGGPVIRDKAFFHFTYEGVRQNQSYSNNGTVYTPSAKDGIFRYYNKGQNSVGLVDSNTGAPLIPDSDISTIDLLTVDPTRLGRDTSGLWDALVGGFPLPNNYDIGDGFNTAGYRYSYPRNTSTNQFVLKGDYALTSNHRLSATYAWLKYTDPGSLLLNGQRGTYESTDLQPTGIVALDSTFTPHLLNEFRVGGVKYDTSSVNPDPNRFNSQGVVVFAGLGGPGRGTSGPINIGLMDVFSPAVITIADNMTWIRGNHSFRGGIDLRINRDQIKYGDDYWIPVVDTTYANNPANIPALPGLSGADRNFAAQLTNDLTGSVGLIHQVYNANSKTSYTPFEVPYRQFRAREWSFFFQDTYKVKPNLTLNLGLRYEVFPAQYEDAGLYAYPVDGVAGIYGMSGPAGETRMGLAANGGRGIYSTDWNNFAPNVGFNWDPRNDGKWSISANYRIAYDRHYFTNTLFMNISQEGMRTDQQLAAPSGMRLTDLASLFNSATGYFDPGVPFGPKDYNRLGLVTAWDPGYYTPYTGSWSLRIQRELMKNTVVAVSYVGNKATGQMRSVDVNQLEIRQNGFLDGFIAAQNNLIASGDPLQGDPTGVFGQIYSVLSTSDQNSQRSNLRNGAVASFADFIDRSRAGSDYLEKAGLPLNFFRANPQFQTAWIQGNNSNSSYHGMKLEVNRRFHQGLQFDANYTFSKALTDYDGGQSQRNAYRDNQNRKLDKTYANIDARHVLNANFIWEIPVGSGRQWLSGGSPIVNGILGGWQLNGIFGYASGRPFTIDSGYYKLTTGDRSNADCSGCDPGMTSKIIRGDRLMALTPDEISQFSSPPAGSAGQTAQYLFRGVSQWTADASVFKAFPLRFLGEQGELQSRFELVNAFNHPRFGTPTSRITSGTFGVVSFPTSYYRIIQIALKVLF